MANDCTTSTPNPGKLVTVSYAVGCGNADFDSLTYMPLGTVNSKQLSYAAQMASTTNDLSGAYTSEIVVRSGLELTVFWLLNRS